MSYGLNSSSFNQKQGLKIEKKKHPWQLLAGVPAEHNNFTEYKHYTRSLWDHVKVRQKQGLIIFRTDTDQHIGQTDHISPSLSYIRDSSFFLHYTSGLAVFFLPPTLRLLRNLQELCSERNLQRAYLNKVLIQTEDLCLQEKENIGKYPEDSRYPCTSSGVLFHPHRTCFVSGT